MRPCCWRAARSYASAACARMGLPSAAAVTRSASPAAQAASAAPSGLVAFVICAAAASVMPAACRHRSSRPCGVSRGPRCRGPAHRRRSSGQDRSVASLPPPYQTGPRSWSCRRAGRRVPGDLAGVPGAVPQPDTDPGLVQAGEEVPGAAGCRGGGGHVAAQRNPGRLGPAAPRGFLLLRAGSGSDPRCGRPGRWTAARTAARRPGRRRGPRTGHSTWTPAAGPGGPASPRYGRDQARAGPRSTAPPHLPPRAGTGRPGPSRHGRPAPTPDPAAAGPRGRHAPGSATPGSRTHSCPAHRGDISAGR
jgi:hypothetical protein